MDAVNQAGTCQASCSQQQQSTAGAHQHTISLTAEVRFTTSQQWTSGCGCLSHGSHYWQCLTLQVACCVKCSVYGQFGFGVIVGRPCVHCTAHILCWSQSGKCCQAWPVTPLKGADLWMLAGCRRRSLMFDAGAKHSVRWTCWLLLCNVVCHNCM